MPTDERRAWDLTQRGSLANDGLALTCPLCRTRIELLVDEDSNAMQEKRDLDGQCEMRVAGIGVADVTALVHLPPAAWLKVRERLSEVPY
jgi:hypothetical protein